LESSECPGTRAPVILTVRVSRERPRMDRTPTRARSMRRLSPPTPRTPQAPLSPAHIAACNSGRSAAVVVVVSKSYLEKDPGFRPRRKPRGRAASRPCGGAARAAGCMRRREKGGGGGGTTPCSRASTAREQGSATTARTRSSHRAKTAQHALSAVRAQARLLVAARRAARGAAGGEGRTRAAHNSIFGHGVSGLIDHTFEACHFRASVSLEFRPK